MTRVFAKHVTQTTPYRIYTIRRIYQIKSVAHTIHADNNKKTLNKILICY